MREFATRSLFNASPPLSGDPVGEQTDKHVQLAHSVAMKVIHVDRLEESVVVAFEDGMTVLYSYALLCEIAPRAQILPPPEQED